MTATLFDGGRQRDSRYEARAWAAQPQDGGGDLVSASKPADRLARLGMGNGEFPLGDHVGDHRRFARAGADGVDEDPARRILQREALGRAEHAVLGGASGVADKAAERLIGDVAGHAERRRR
jgi:hypothetical protein